MKKKFAITKKTKIMTILKKNPKAVEILLETGLTCLGCAFAKQETLEQGLKIHGFTKKEIENLIKELNKK
jgi:hybrid cluster-associated redox disulfide protein